jgi:GT2 family glycosyltransferase
MGGFDEDYFCYHEDVDLSFRLRLQGHRCLYVPEARVEHLGSASSERESDFVVYHGHRNLVWTFFKNMPPTLLIRYLPAHLLLNLVTLLWFTSSGRGRVLIRSKRDALLGLSRTLEKRKAIQ